MAWSRAATARGIRWVIIVLLTAFIVVRCTDISRLWTRLPYGTEQGWLVDEITRDITEMLAYAAGGTNTVGPAQLTLRVAGPTADPPVFKITAKLHSPSLTISQSITVDSYIWCPRHYAPLAGELTRRLALKPAPAAEAPARTAALLLLTDLRAEIIQDANQRTSKQLRENFLEPATHERAALILGALALREAAGDFADLRQVLCRMTAHLAVADALRADANAGLEGQVAETILLTLCGRQRDALEKLAALKQPAGKSEALENWITALHLRITGDYRTLHHPPTATLLERLEYFRALYDHIAPNAAVMFLRQGAPEKIPDWGRIVLERNFSVGEGHMFVPTGLANELTEMSTIWTACRRGELRPDEIAGPLNEPAGRCVAADGTVAVISWGTWAAHCQRHLLHQIERGIWFMRDRWSVKERAEEYTRQAEKHFGKLTLFPVLVKRYSQEEAPYRAAVRAAIPVVKTHPELLNDANWACLRHTPSFCSLEAGVPELNWWFTPALPHGTVFDTFNRFFDLDQLTQSDVASLQPLRALAPYNAGIIAEYTRRKFPKRMTTEDMRDAYGPLCDYDVSVMERIAETRRDHPQEYAEVFEKICRIEPNHYLTLGYYFTQHKMEAEAAEAYQKAVDLASDRVWVANSCDWLVNYYYDHGRTNDAVGVAQMAAEVYSRRGLATMARLMERMGRLDETEDYYRKIRERYEDKDELLGFYFRCNQKQPGGTNTRKFNALLKVIFPKGLEQVSFAELKDPPAQGVRITSSSPTLEYWKLRQGDVIVSLDGYRVSTEEQYTSVLAFTTNPKMTLVVWRDDQYAEYKVDQPGRRFGVGLADYRR